MKPVIHLVDVTNFVLPDGTASADWFRGAFERLRLTEAIKLAVHDGIAGDLPALPAVRSKHHGVIISGSYGPVYEAEPWIEPLLSFLRKAHRLNVWMLGVCFGHHALAVALGGEVRPNPRGREMGSVPIYLTSEGEQNPLFEGFRSGDLANLVHKTHVTKLPEGAVRLAFNQMTPTQAFRLGRSFGLQLHPELGPVEMEQFIGMYGKVLIGKEKFLDNDEHMLNFKKTFRDTPSACSILRNFVTMISP